MEITKELLQTIYDRAFEYARARYGEEPDRVAIQDGGSICVVYTSYCCGSYEENYEYFDASCLTADLDDVREERKREEEKIRIQKEKDAAEQRKRIAERERADRYRTFMALKKEFDS